MTDAADDTPASVVTSPPPPWHVPGGRGVADDAVSVPAGSASDDPRVETTTWVASGRSRGTALHRALIAGVVAAGALVLVVTATAYADSAIRGDRVLAGVRMGAVDLGGKSPDEARAAVAQYAESLLGTPVPITVEDTEVQVDPRQFGFSVDVDKAVENAMAVGRSGWPLARGWDWFTERDIAVPLRADDAVLRGQVGSIQFDGQIEPVEPQVSVEDGEVVVEDPVVGHDIVVDEAVVRIGEAVERNPHPRVRLPVADIPPRFSTDDARAAADAAEAMRGRSIHVELAGLAAAELSAEGVDDMIGGHVEADGYRVGIDEESLRKGMETLLGKVGTPTADAAFDLADGTIKYVEGSPGYGCCVPGSAAELERALVAKDKSVTLRPGEKPPKLTVADLKAMGPIQKLSEFTTHHKCCESRVENIHKAADTIRSDIVMPGEQWSMNDALGGPRKKRDGWAMAPSIADGEHKDSPGGGISQVATTTYNALFYAGVQVDQHKAHSQYFTRYPKGREATLGYPYPDLKFTNDTPGPLVIWTAYDDTSVYVSLWGTSDGRVVTESEPKMGRRGSCTTVSIVRTITWPDGRQKEEKIGTEYQHGGPCVADKPDSDSGTKGKSGSNTD